VVEGGALHRPIFKFGEFLVSRLLPTTPPTASAWCWWNSGSRWASPLNRFYPYKTALGVQRPLLIAMMILAAIFLAAGGL